jgi:hypothetical protein
MKTRLFKKKSAAAPLAASLVGLTAVLLAAGIWYLWFRPTGDELSDDELREIQAFEEYEQQKSR